MLDLHDSPAAPEAPAAPGHGPEPLSGRVGRVAAMAGRHAEAVDRDARFPAEAVAALRAEALFGLLVPRSLGGEEAALGTVVDICYRLGRACSSTAMIYAMHQVKVACVVRHGAGNPWQDGLLRRLAADQLLFASSTTEGQGGGNVRSSAAPILREGDRVTLDRAATVMSYGAQADAIVTTARRSPEAAASDQVLAVFLKGDYALGPSGGWNTLGMRGTCSGGFALKAEGCADQVLAAPYETIHARTMTPVSHLVWSAVWTGIAAAAVERAQAFMRKAARRNGGQMPPGVAHYAKAASTLAVLRSLVGASVARYDRALADPAVLGGLEFQTAITLLKVETSEMAVATVLAALRACGLSGYRTDGEASVGRHLRDVLSAPLMVNNDRILTSLAATALMTPVPSSLGLAPADGDLS